MEKKQKKTLYFECEARYKMTLLILSTVPPTHEPDADMWSVNTKIIYSS